MQVCRWSGVFGCWLAVLWRLLITNLRFVHKGLWVVMLVSLSACGKKEVQPEPIRAVKLLTVAASSVGAQDEFAAEVKARVETRLGFRVGGKLAQRHVELGQAVKPGQLLAQLEPQDFQLAVQVAQAQLQAAQTQQELAAAEYQRFAALRDRNFISSVELERREQSLKTAQAQLEQAQAQLAVQKNQASYTQLRADGAGVITAVEAEPGQVLAAGSPVVRLARDGAREVEFSLPENMNTRLALGTVIQVRPWAQATEYSATVREVAASADALTRSFRVRATLPPQAQLPLGATVSVRWPTLAPTVVLIKLPTNALRAEAGATAVWVYDPASQSVRSRAVVVSGADGNDALISAGLSAGERVVAAGVHLLNEGQRVQVYQEKAPQEKSSQSGSPQVPKTAAATSVAAAVSPRAAASR